MGLIYHGLNEEGVQDPPQVVLLFPRTVSNISSGTRRPKHLYTYVCPTTDYHAELTKQNFRYGRNEGGRGKVSK